MICPKCSQVLVLVLCTVNLHAQASETIRTYQGKLIKSMDQNGQEMTLVTDSKSYHFLKVEILSSEASTWQTHWSDPGSPGTVNTTCNSDDSGLTTCTSNVEGQRAPSESTINHMRIDLLVKMPDENQVKMQCHYPPIWAYCLKLEPGTYWATIDKHDIHVIIQSQGRPEYNKDGSLKKAGKINLDLMKFSFE